eukprot:COSAG02_NODE_846_length_16565_cov_20.404627_14_plen_72_part_00
MLDTSHLTVHNLLMCSVIALSASSVITLSTHLATSRAISPPHADWRGATGGPYGAVCGGFRSLQAETATNG